MSRPWGILVAVPLFCLAALLAVSFAFDGHAATPSTDDPNAEHWKNGELVAPLPVDPTLRAEAIRRAKAARTAPPGERLAAAPVKTASRTITATRITNVKRTPLEALKARRAGLPFPDLLRAPGEPFRASDAQRRESDERSVKIAAAPAEAATGGVGGYFDAITDTGWIPASPSIATGTGQVLLATSDVFAVYDKCGNYEDGGVFQDYFGLMTDYLYYDPKVIYDDWNGRWIMVYQSNDLTHQVSQFIVCISVSANLEDGWGGYYQLFDPSPTDFIDNTYIAVDPEGLYISFNAFDYTTNAYEWPMIIGLEKDDIYNFAGTTMHLWYNLHNPDDSSPAQSVRPARMHSYGGYMYFLNNKPIGGDRFTRWILSDPFGTTPLLQSVSTLTPSYELPPPMRQPDGTYVRSGDCRITDLLYAYGYLQAAFTRLYTSAGDWSRVSLAKFHASSGTYNGTRDLTSEQGYLAYGSLDIDEVERTCVTFEYCSYARAEYLSIGTWIFDWNEPTNRVTVSLAVGTNNYAGGGAGTVGNPYRWGNYTGCQTDPVDDRIFWCVGTYPPSEPVPSWSTRIGALTAFEMSDLHVSPGDLTAGGFPSGPFWPNVFSYTLENEGATSLNWHLGDLPPWLTPSDTGGVIPPYGSQNVVVTLNDQADYLPLGLHTATLAFDNCTGSGSTTRRILLFVSEEITCAGSLMELEPSDAGGGYMSTGPRSVSAFIRPAKDVHVCAIGIQTPSPYPYVFTARVYEAEDFVRQTMIGDATLPAVEMIGTSRIVPVDVTLEACRDYEIEIAVPPGMSYLYFDEGDFSYPVDVGGVVRVTEGGSGGDYTATQLPAISIYGYSPCTTFAHGTDLLPSGTTGLEFDGEREGGLFVTAHDNMELCSVGFEADLPTGTPLRARLWGATGNVRTQLIAEGGAMVETGGLATHTVPLHALLEYGQDYDLEVMFEDGGVYTFADESELTLPFVSDDGAVEVRKGSSAGAEWDRLPHLQMSWDDFVSGGAPFDLAKTADGVPPPYSSTGPLDHGALVTASVDQQIFGLGVKADIPPGSVITARVYSMLKGSRNLLMGEGSIHTSRQGMQWHDIPIGAHLVAGRTYDLSVVCSTINEFNYWDDATGMPYSAYGLYDVVDAETAGSSTGTELVYLRVHGCDNQLTGVAVRAPSYVPLYLRPPRPNPVGGIVTFHYDIGEAGTADMVLYDVLGRRVATVFRHKTLETGPGVVEFDTGGLASGVYFMRLVMPGRASMSRKVVIEH